MTDGGNRDDGGESRGSICWWGRRRWRGNKDKVKRMEMQKEWKKNFILIKVTDVYGCCVGATGEMLIYSFSCFASQSCQLRCDFISSRVIHRFHFALSDSKNMIVIRKMTLFLLSVIKHPTSDCLEIEEQMPFMPLLDRMKRSLCHVGFARASWYSAHLLQTILSLVQYYTEKKRKNELKAITFFLLLITRHTFNK